jgi:hypothetical protein
MIGRLLCRLGLHDWKVVQFYYAGWLACARCGARL